MNIMNTNNNSILGTWQNQAPYNSSLQITSYDPDDGQITGVYKSSTGSSGTYPFIGYVHGKEGTNNSICLAINWKATSGTFSNFFYCQAYGRFLNIANWSRKLCSYPNYFSKLNDGYYIIEFNMIKKKKSIRFLKK